MQTPITDLSQGSDDDGLGGVSLRVEFAFVAVAFLTGTLGLLAPKLGLPSNIEAICFGLSLIAGGWFGSKTAAEALRQRKLSMDTLMLLAAGAAVIIGEPFEGAMLLFLFSLSNALQRLATDRSRNAIGSLLELRPETATVLAGGGEKQVRITEIEPGDVIVVRPGDVVPLDGTIIDGEGSLDESSLTGESVPVDRRPGDLILAGAVNSTGKLEVQVSRAASETALARMIDLVEEAQGEKAQTQRLIDRIEQPYALGVILVTLLSIPLFLLREPLSEAVYRSMTLMVAASPCALVLSTPTAILSAIAVAARRGILFKGGVFVEQASRIRCVAFDKTGTLTEGRAKLTDIHPFGGAEPDETLQLAAAAQEGSEHHLAKATLKAAKAHQLELPEASDFVATIGRGIEAQVQGQAIRMGNADFFTDLGTPVNEPALEVLRHYQDQAKTATLVTIDGEPAAVLAFADTLRPNTKKTIRGLRAAGVETVVMLTGDNESVARAIATEAGIDDVRSGLLPAAKVDVLRRLRKRYGPVAMVGDGVNDAPALATADLGIAMGAAGTDVALENADLVLMSEDLGRLPFAIELSRKARQTLRTNLTLAFSAIIIMVGLILTIGVSLPMAVIVHEGSTVLVGLNGLRLLALRPTESTDAMA